MGVEAGPSQPLLHPPDAGAIHAERWRTENKPTQQHSVPETARDRHLPGCAVVPVRRSGAEDEKRKIALFTNVEQRAVISVPDVDTIFKVPQMLHDQMLDEIVWATRWICWRNPANPRRGRTSLSARCARTRVVDIALVGKYVELIDAWQVDQQAR